MADGEDDLIMGMFTLADKDKALYYFEANVSGNSTKSTASYDIRIAYTDEDKNECFFRDLPLGTISQITLCMDGTDDDAIPYAKYLTGNSTNEVSTLNDVKRRLGLLDDSENSDSSDSEVTPTPTDSDNSSSDNSSGSDNQDDPGNQDDRLIREVMIIHLIREAMIIRLIRETMMILSRMTHLIRMIRMILLTRTRHLIRVMTV